GVNRITNKPAWRGDAGVVDSRGRHKYSTTIMSEGAVYANENSTADRYVQSLPARSLRPVDGFEEAPVAIRRAGQDQQEGGRQIHRLGISFIRRQSRPQAGEEDRSGVACDRLVAGPLFHRNLRYHQGTWRLEAQVHADRHPTKPL